MSRKATNGARLDLVPISAHLIFLEVVRLRHMIHAASTAMFLRASSSLNGGRDGGRDDGSQSIGGGISFCQYAPFFGVFLHVCFYNACHKSREMVRG